MGGGADRVNGDETAPAHRHLRVRPRERSPPVGISGLPHVLLPGGILSEAQRKAAYDVEQPASRPDPRGPHGRRSACTIRQSNFCSCRDALLCPCMESARLGGCEPRCILLIRDMERCGMARCPRNISPFRLSQPDRDCGAPSYRALDLRSPCCPVSLVAAAQLARTTVGRRRPTGHSPSGRGRRLIRLDCSLDSAATRRHGVVVLLLRRRCCAVTAQSRRAVAVPSRRLATAR